MTHEQIANSLTGKQAAALRGVFKWSSPHEQDEGERVLYQLGLWSPKPGYRGKVITDLGLAVRAILEKQA